MAENEIDSPELSCSKCLKVIADESYINCYGPCKSVYHAECSELKKNVIKTIKPIESVKWYCQVCNKYITKLQSSDLLSAIEELIDKKFYEMKTMFENEKKSLVDIINKKFDQNKPSSSVFVNKSCGSENQQNPCQSYKSNNNIEPAHQNLNCEAEKKSYSSVTKNIPSNRTLFLKTNQSFKNPDEFCKKIKSTIKNPSKLSIDINSIKSTKTGVLISCSDDNSLKKLKTTLQNQMDLNCDQETNAILPKIIIYGASPDDVNDNPSLESDIIEANNLSKENKNFSFKIVRKINQADHVNLIAAVDPLTRNSITQKGYLQINWTRCRVKDSYHIKFCNNCSSFGHLSSNCSSKFPVCFKCADCHLSTLCTSTVLKCANCIRYNKTSKSPIEYNHTAKDRKCPCYIHKMELLKKKANSLIDST